jgi:predicted porin
MNKKLLSLAVAAALVAPAAAMAEATLYGKLNVSLDYADVKNVVLPTYGYAEDANGNIILDQNGNPTWVQTAPGEDFDGWGMSGNGYIPGVNRSNRLGVKGSEDLGGGLKAIYQVELGINLNDTNSNVLNNGDAITYRNTFVGLAGGFGTALVGRHDTPLKISTGKLDLFADTMADYNGTVGFRDLRADNVVAYISPSFSGFTFAGAIVPAGGASGGAAGLNLDEDSIAGAYSLAGIYSNGPFYASIAYESLGSDHFNTQNVSINGRACPYTTPAVPAPGQPFFASCDFTSEDATAWRVGLGLLDWNGFTLTGIYENRDNDIGSGPYDAYVDPTNLALSWYLPGASNKTELWQIQAGYSFGNSMVKAMYGQADRSSDLELGAQYVAIRGGAQFANNLVDAYDGNLDTWAVGYDYNFSKRTKVYALYTQVTDDAENVDAGSEWSGFSLGMMHSF